MKLRNKTIITIIIIAIVIALSNKVIASSSMKFEIPIVKQNKEIDLNEIIEKNEKDVITERIEKNEIDVEFSTHYRENNSLAKGKIQTLQEGQDGKQNAIVKSIYKEGELIKNEQLSSEVTKAAIDRIVEIGTAAYLSITKR